MVINRKYLIAFIAGLSTVSFLGKTSHFAKTLFIPLITQNENYGS